MVGASSEPGPVVEEAARPGPVVEEAAPPGPVVEEAAQRPSRNHQRIIVVGTTGSGKTTLAAAIAERWGIRHVEIDALFHGPGWTPRPEFLDDVRAFAAQDSWVTEWQYPEARPLLLERATLAVWLDYPLPMRLWRNVRRTVVRRVQRIELWNGNVEGSLWRAVTDPEGIIRWAWRTRHLYDDLPALLGAQGRPELPVVRLRSQRATDEWLARL